MLLGYYSPRFLCKLLWCFDFTDFDENTPRQKEADRKRSLDIERWLKNKFREGFQNLKIAFEEMDSEKSGVVSLLFAVSGSQLPISKLFCTLITIINV